MIARHPGRFIGGPWTGQFLTAAQVDERGLVVCDMVDEPSGRLIFVAAPGRERGEGKIYALAGGCGRPIQYIAGADRYDQVVRERARRQWGLPLANGTEAGIYTISAEDLAAGGEPCRDDERS